MEPSPAILKTLPRVPWDCCAILEVVGCRTGIMFLHILGEQRRAQSASRVKKITPVCIPLFKLFHTQTNPKWPANHSVTKTVVTMPRCMAFHPRQNSMLHFTFYFSQFILPLLFDIWVCTFFTIFAFSSPEGCFKSAICYQNYSLESAPMVMLSWWLKEKFFTRKVWGLCIPWYSTLRPPTHWFVFLFSILIPKEVISPI